MCGIIFINRHDGLSAPRAVWKRYERQKSRGQQGFGYLAIADNKITSYQRARTENEIKEKLQKETAPSILFHHRAPTSTPNLPDYNHPIKITAPIFKKIYYLAHNGIITNDKEQKEKHDALKIPYTTRLTQTWETISTRYDLQQFNDSETFGIELALRLEKKKKTINADGDTAFVCLETDEKNRALRLHFGKNNGNPLKFYQQKELTAITSACGGNDLEADILYTFTYKSGKLTRLPLQFGQTPPVKPLSPFGKFKTFGNLSDDYDDDTENDFNYSADEQYIALIERQQTLEDKMEFARYRDDYDTEQRLQRDWYELNEKINNYLPQRQQYEKYNSRLWN